MIYERICLCEAAAGVPPQQSAVDGTFGLHLREWVWCPDCQLRTHRHTFMQCFYESQVGAVVTGRAEAGCVCLCVQGAGAGGLLEGQTQPLLWLRCLQAAALREEAALAAAQRARGIIGPRTLAGRLARMAQQVDELGIVLCRGRPAMLQLRSAGSSDAPM